MPQLSSRYKFSCPRELCRGLSSVKGDLKIILPGFLIWLLLIAGNAIYFAFISQVIFLFSPLICHYYYYFYFFLSLLNFFHPQLAATMKEWDIPFEDLHVKEAIGKGRIGTVYRQGLIKMLMLMLMGIVFTKKKKKNTFIRPL